MTIRDDDGIPIKSGDYITFSFGIPPVSVLAKVHGEDHDLGIVCLDPADVKPKRESLKNLMKYYQVWKAQKGRISAYERTFARKEAPNE